MNWIKLVIAGCIIGVANIIPGVSGGTMAVILNIYDRLIHAISRFRKEWRRQIRFLGAIFIGAGIGIIAFSHMIKWLLERYPMQLNWFFIGLIIGSIPLILMKVRKKRDQVFNKIAVFLIFFAVMLYFASINRQADAGVVEKVMSLPLFLQLFVHAILASAAMILPGVSGSLVLVILGSYFTVLTAIAEMNLLLLIPVGLGVAVGIVGGSKLMAYALRRWEGITFSGIMGLVLGSIFTVYRAAGFSFNLGGFVSVLCMAAGAALALWFGQQAK
ncbi:MAG: DUF368 domain-containing protein [Eubacteriales bacterium]|nr:DUF368 domain-containing protein [Eubacteriales bacterium]